MDLSFTEKLSSWFLENRRSFPWRDEPTPYAVLVSEVMLQQTQASVVLPFYERWMKEIPTLRALAEAPFAQVLKLWEGLGYYSRVRRLHAAAQMIARDHQGKIPSKREELEKIPGLGPYTIGALLTFGFHLREPAVDGNVLRVAARLLKIEEEIEQISVREQVTEWVKESLQNETPWVTMEALIELGAVVCMKKPLCSRCPVRHKCLAYAEEMTDVLPKRRKRPKTTILAKRVAVVFFQGEVQGEILVRRIPPGRVMADLYEFPSSEIPPIGPHEEIPHDLAPVTHTFTRYRATLFPTLLKAHERRTIEGFEWHPFQNLLTLPFSSGHRKILHALQQIEDGLI